MIEKICKLLESDQAELQCAAATVLGELRPKDDLVRKSLQGALRSSGETVQRYALEALVRIGIEPSLDHVVPLLGASPPIRQRATQILLEQGEKAMKLLRDRLPKAVPHVRRGILEVLGQSGGEESIETLFEAMLDDEFEVSRQATDSILTRLKQLPDPERPKVCKKVLSFLKEPRVRKKTPATIGGIKILGYLGLPAAVPSLLGYVGAKNPPNVRTHALTALSHLDVTKDAKAVSTKLLPLLQEEDFAQIGERALAVIRKCDASSAPIDLLLQLLKSAHPPVRLFAAQALGRSGTAAAGLALTGLIFHDDARLSETAVEALRTSPDCAPVLVKALQKEKDPQKAWKIANILRAYRQAVGKPVLRQFLKKCLSMIAKKEPGFTVYFEILRSGDPDTLREALLKEGRRLLSKKKLEEAESHLRLLERDDLATDETIFALAICRLRTLQKDLSQANRDRSHAVSLFCRLVNRKEFPVVARLQKETSILTPVDYLYLGFCLAERSGAEREAGGAILKFTAKKYASKPEGKTAKQKLSTQGLG